MTLWSLLAGLIGGAATWLATRRFSQSNQRRPIELYWALGMAALIPAWLLAFLGLVGSFTGRRPDMALGAFWILSSAAALLGAIVTSAILEGRRESGREVSPVAGWLLGLAAIGPAWGLALLGQLILAWMERQ
jgi:hypothetical protein